MSVLLSLDLSTTCTGWAKFDLATGRLLSYGAVTSAFKPKKVKGQPRLGYPQLQVLKLRELALQVVELIDPAVCAIVIEEINSGKSRLGQKTLDGFHYLLLDRMREADLFKVTYRDSDGRYGWRSASGLNLMLSPEEKLINKDRKKFNRRLGRGQKKLPVINQKNLAVRFVNQQFGLALNLETNPEHGDIADAIGLGYFALSKNLHESKQSA